MNTLIRDRVWRSTTSSRSQSRSRWKSRYYSPIERSRIAVTLGFTALKSDLEVDWWDDLLERDEPLIQDGYIEVPETPGIGVELDEDVVKAHALDGTATF